jgi:hypothetical protein
MEETKETKELNELNINKEDLFHLQEEELNKFKKDNILFEKIHVSLNYFFSPIINRTIFFIINIAGIYIVWIGLHFIASHLYIKFCVPFDVYGFLISPFLTATPHCQGLRWIISNGANIINNMWVIIGTWICSNVLFNKDLPTNH